MLRCMIVLTLLVAVNSSKNTEKSPKNVTKIVPHDEGYATPPPPTVPKKVVHPPPRVYAERPQSTKQKVAPQKVIGYSVSPPPHRASQKARRVQNQGPQCGPNARATFCNGCEGTCDRPNANCPFFCDFGTGANCQCRSGYVRSDGRCISASYCPKSCPANQEYRICASACEPTCDNQNPSCSLQCIAARCQCALGFVRNSNNDCVAPSSCTAQTCGMNEVFNQCASACEPTCQNQNTFCSLQCLSPRCQCATGFVRQNGQCIWPQYCPSQPTSCPDNEVWTQCSSVCEPSCGNNSPNCNSFACGTPKCQCRQNFYRQASFPNPPCVAWWQCNSNNIGGGVRPGR